MAKIFKVEYQVVMTPDAVPIPNPPVIDSKTGLPVSADKYAVLDSPDHATGTRKSATWGSNVRVGDLYRRSVVIAVVQAASQHPADLLVPLKNNVPLMAGETIEIQSCRELVGAESNGATILV